MRSKLLVLLATLMFPLFGFSANSVGQVKVDKSQGVQTSAVLWREPSDIETRDLYYGSGGEAGQPREPFKFIEEDRGGTNPKFIIEDGQGVRWKVKLGEETNSETAATRLLWAAGYFSDVTYYVPRMRVEGLIKLSRGQKYVSPGGAIQNARLERVEKGRNKISDWSWFDNPFVGTREFDGLRVMMALMNNWDLKQTNNAVHDFQGQELHYVVSDLGGTFGRTGGDWSRSKSNLSDYVESDFIDQITPTSVDLVLRSRPPALYAVHFPYYRARSRMSKIADDIPRAHAKWVGQLLSRLSDEQLKAAFTGAGYPAPDADAYARKVRERISKLNEL